MNSFDEDKIESFDHVNLTKKEIGRAEHGRTVIVRAQASGGYLVAVVKVCGSIGQSMGRTFTALVEDKSDIPRAVRDVVRWLSKIGYDSNMSLASRHRGE